MYKLKTYKLLLYLALAMMVVFVIIIIVDYVTKGSTDGGWSGLASMTIVALIMLSNIRDIKKKGRE